MTKCNYCSKPSKTKCEQCNIAICSQACLKDHIDLQDIGVRVRYDDPWLKKREIVSVKMTGYSDEFKGGWLRGRIVRTPERGDRTALVKLELIDIYPKVRTVAFSRLQPWRDTTVNHDWKIGDKVHVRRNINYGDKLTEVWWEAKVEGFMKNQMDSLDRVRVKYKYKYYEEDQVQITTFSKLRLADMDDYRPLPYEEDDIFD